MGASLLTPCDSGRCDRCQPEWRDLSPSRHRQVHDRTDKFTIAPTRFRIAPDKDLNRTDKVLNRTDWEPWGADDSRLSTPGSRRRPKPRAESQEPMGCG